MTSYIYNMVDTWASGGGPYTSIKMNATDNDVGSASLLMDLQIGGSSRFKVAKGGLATVGSLGFSAHSLSLSAPDGATISYLTSGSNFLINGTASSLALASTMSIAWSSSSQFGYASRDTFLTRRGAANLRLGAADAAAPVAQTLSVQSVVAGTSNTAGVNLTITGSQGTGTGAGGSIIFQVAPAGSSGTAQNALASVLQLNGAGGITGWDGTTANTLALRNGANAQAFRVYNTYTDDSNYERAFLAWSANVFNVGTSALGTGTARAFALSSANEIRFQPNNTLSWTMSTSGHLLAGNDNTYDIGASGATRPRNVFIGSYMQMTEMTAPAAPATNNVRIYAVDNGSGKTQLMALFATGAAQQIAIEP